MHQDTVAIFLGQNAPDQRSPKRYPRLPHPHGPPEGTGYMASLIPPHSGDSEKAGLMYSETVLDQGNMFPLMSWKTIDASSSTAMQDDGGNEVEVRIVLPGTPPCFAVQKVLHAAH